MHYILYKVLKYIKAGFTCLLLQNHSIPKVDVTNSLSSSDKETSLHTKKNHNNNIIKLKISTSSSRKVLLRVPQCAARVYIKIRTRNIWCRKIAQQNEYNHADCSFSRTHNIFYKKNFIWNNYRSDFVSRKQCDPSL